MSRNIAPFGLRMPPELKSRLERESKISGRSMNAELVWRLQASLVRVHHPGADLSHKIESVEKFGGAEEIGDHERKLLANFRRLDIKKQMALLVLLE